MQNYKDVCGDKQRVWFEISENENGKRIISYRCKEII